MHWPYDQPATGRGVRTSPLHERLAARGACFGEAAGWERANWFAPEGVDPVYEYSYQRQNWFPHAAAEHKAVREAVGLFDMTSFAKFLVEGADAEAVSFAKFLVEGADAEAVLQRICANDMAVPPGKVVYTQWLNERWTWLRRNTPEDARCTVTDITSGLAVLSVMGPNSRDLLSRVTDVDLSNEAFPFGTAQEIELGYATLRAVRVTFVGELGWELYVPSEFAVHVFDTIMAEGDDFGLKPAGLHVLDSCRIEKAFRHWGHDITDEDTPLEAGLGFAVRLDKNADFIGRDALLKQKEAGKLTRRLVQFALEDPEPLLYHNEPVYRDGEAVGYLTSGNYGHHLGRAVGLGYVNNPDGVTADWVKDGSYEIEVACERFSAQASLRPMYDPKAERVKV
jgi:4-methylaminobutanoate oxidase (formaldehyde-forming)